MPREPNWNYVTDNKRIPYNVRVQNKYIESKTFIFTNDKELIDIEMGNSHLH